jgi:hypothetical protein
MLILVNRRAQSCRDVYIDISAIVPRANVDISEMLPHVYVDITGITRHVMVDISSIRLHMNAYKAARVVTLVCIHKRGHPTKVYVDTSMVTLEDLCAHKRNHAHTCTRVHISAIVPTSVCMCT